MRNLQRTKNFILLYSTINDLEIFGYVDSDVNSSDGRKCTSLCIKMAGGKIFGKSIKQTITTSSNIQAEFVASYGATI